MTRPSVTAVYRTSSLEEYPEFDADYYLDDEESPTTVTICSSESPDRLATEWITCEVSHVVPMESIR